MWQKLYQTVTGPEFLLVSVLFSDWEEDAQSTRWIRMEVLFQTAKLKIPAIYSLRSPWQLYSPELQAKQTLRQGGSS